MLIITADITNYRSTFINLLSFAHLKAKLSFNFIFNDLKKHIFYDPYLIPRVIINDQATRIKALMLITLPNSILQFYD
jgi:hypothetical protein